MSIFVFTNLIAGVSGLDKSALNTASLFAQNGYDAHIINCVGADGGFKFISPKMPVHDDVYIHSLQIFAPDGGKHLHEKFTVAYDLVQPFLKARFTQHDLRALRSFNDMIGDQDLIIFTHPLQSLLYKMAIEGRKIPCKTILQIHGNYAEEHHNRDLLLESLSVIDKIQLVSESMRPGIAEITGFEDKDIVWIPNVHFPIDVKRKPSDTFNVAIIGSLQDRKNQVDAVKAIQLINDETVCLDIWGNDNNEYGRFLKLYVQNLGLGQRVRFRGLGNEADLYATTDLVIITSKHEGFGYTTVEAATHHIPAVAYDYDFGADEFIDDGVNGFIVPMHDINQLAERIQEIRKSSDLRERFAHAAMHTFENKFSPKHILNLYENEFPHKMADRGHQVARHFLRDGKIVAQPGSVKQKNYRVFKKLVASLFKYDETNAVSSYDLARVSDTHDPITVPHSTIKGRAKVLLKRVTRKGRLLSRNYVLAARFADGFSYIMNTRSNGAAEEVREYSRFAPVLEEKSSIANADVLVLANGPYIPYPSYEPIKSLRDEHGEPVPYTTHILTRNGVTAPYFRYLGTFDCLNLIFNSGKKISYARPQVTYKEIFERLLELEKKHDLLNYQIEGVYVWELIRAPILEHLMMAFGMWGQHFASSNAPDARYVGSKKIQDAPSADRLLFEFTRKSGDIDTRTEHLRQDDCIIVEYPQTFGYTAASYAPGPVYPIHAFTQASQKIRKLRRAQQYNERFFNNLFEEEFHVEINFKQIIDGRILKFRRERSFWAEFFAERSFKEVVIPSAYWSAGICAAAKENNVTIIDVQYALEGNLHPTNTFSSAAAYTADVFYAWSDYWKADVPKYENVLVRQRIFPGTEPSRENFDFCILSQPRVKKPIKRFAAELARKHPNKKVAYCLHPDENLDLEKSDASVADLNNLHFAHGNSLSVILSSEVVVGGYSTSLYEAAYFGKSVYVLPVPGWENVERGVEEGIFRLVSPSDDLEPFPPHPIAKTLF